MIAFKKHADGSLAVADLGEPNGDGLYEVPRSVHFVYDAKAAQELLRSLDLTYVGHKPGNYDIELWRKEPMITLGAGIVPPSMNIMGANITGSLSIGTPMATNIDNMEPEDIKLEKTDTVCYQCGSRIGMHKLTVNDHHGRFKTIELHVCMNPACSFHFVNVERS